MTLGNFNQYWFAVTAAAERRLQELNHHVANVRQRVANRLNTSVWSPVVYDDPAYTAAEADVESAREELKKLRKRDVFQIAEGSYRRYRDFAEIRHAYKAYPSPETKRDLYKAYWILMQERATVDMYKSFHNDKDHLYVASLLVPKPDPMGRFILGDLHSTTHLTGEAAHLYAMSGVENPPILCEVHPDHEESMQGDYLRTHSMSPGGARAPGLAFGVPAYIGVALAAHWLDRKDGIFSWDGGGGRLSGGRKIWDDFLKSGDAYEKRFNRTYEGTALQQYMDAERAIDSKLLVFHVSPQADTPVGFIEEHPVLAPWLRSSWSPRDKAYQNARMRRVTENLPDIPQAVHERLFDDDQPILRSKETRQMLANSVHGGSPVLIATIAETLSRSGATDLAAAYLSRTDIAPIVARHPRLLTLVGQRSLPGLSGMGDHTHRAVMSAVREAQDDRIQIDWSAENPLRLTPLSAETRKFIAKYDTEE